MTMRAHVLTGRIAGEYLPPTVYTDPTELPNPLPPGTTVEEVALPPENSPNGWDIEKAKGYYEMGKVMYDAGKGSGIGMSPELALSMIATGAAAGGWIGAAIAVVVCVVIWLTEDKPDKGWEDAGPGVHAWFACVGPEEFLAWVLANNAGALGSVDAIQKTFAIWTVEKLKSPIRPELDYWGIKGSTFFLGPDVNIPNIWTDFQMDVPTEEQREEIRSWPTASMPPWIYEAYAQLGIDYQASLDNIRNEGGSGFMMTKMGITLVDEGTTETEGSGMDGAAPLLLLGAFMLMKK